MGELINDRKKLEIGLEKVDANSELDDYILIPEIQIA